MFGAFDTFWADRTPIAWPNQPFDPESIGEAEGAAWVRPFLLGDVDGQRQLTRSTNPQHFERRGIFTLSIYVRQGSVQTTDQAYALGEAALQFVELPNVPNALFTDQGLVEVGPDGTWWQLDASMRYRYFTDRPA